MAVIAGLALVGCVEKEKSNFRGEEDQQILFNAPMVSPATRAPITGTAYPEDGKFMVYACKTAGNYAAGDWKDENLYMNAVEVSRKTSSAKSYWAPEDDYFWPKTGVLTFAAYSPSSVSAQYDATGLKVSSFSSSTTPAGQVDLMYAPRVYNKTANDYPLGGAVGNPNFGVSITFRHALSLVQFRIKKGSGLSGSAVTLTDISLSAVRSQGIFNEKITDGTDYVSYPVWTSQASPATYAVLTGGSQVLTEMLADGGEKNLLIPQTLESGVQKLTVKWTYTQGNGTVVSDEYTMDLLTPTIGAWDVGKRYTYNITIGLDKIYFNPIVEDWDDLSSNIYAQ